MKKLICSLLSAVMLLGLVSCSDGKTTETTPVEEKETTVSTTEEPITTSAVPESDVKPMDFSIVDVARSVLDAMGSDYEISIFASDKNKDENLKLGVLNYLIIGAKDFRLQTNVGDFDSMFIEICIVEFDMDSELYKGLKTGEPFMFFDGGSKTKVIVSGINKQFVMCVNAAYGKDGLYETGSYEKLPPFSVGETQIGYDKFMALGTDLTGSGMDTNTSLADVSRQIISALGDSYVISGFADKDAANENNKLGVLDYVLITNENRSLEKEIKGNDSFYADYYIFEFDTQSNVYSSLSVGSQFFFFYRPFSKEKLEVAAINKQFVISISVYYGNGNSYSTEYKETQPDYSVESVQKGYEAFLELKETGKRPSDALQMSLADLTLAMMAEFDDYKNFHFANPNDAKSNSSAGIVDAVDYKLMDGVENDYRMLDMFIIEYDTDSENYKKLFVGDTITVYIQGTSYELVIAAINKQYVLCEYVKFVNDSALTLEEKEMPFTYDRAKTAYRVFTAFE